MLDSIQFDILVEIFGHVANGNAARKEERSSYEAEKISFRTRVFPLLLVCRRWNAVVNSRALFWPLASVVFTRPRQAPVSGTDADADKNRSLLKASHWLATLSKTGASCGGNELFSRLLSTLCTHCDQPTSLFSCTTVGRVCQSCAGTNGLQNFFNAQIPTPEFFSDVVPVTCGTLYDLQVLAAESARDSTVVNILLDRTLTVHAGSFLPSLVIPRGACVRITAADEASDCLCTSTTDYPLIQVFGTLVLQRIKLQSGPYSQPQEILDSIAAGRWFNALMSVSWSHICVDPTANTSS